MSKTITTAVAVLLAFAMLFSFAGCIGQDEEETTTTVKTNTPLPTELTTSVDENGETVTQTDYTPEQRLANTAEIFEYFNLHINELKGIKASISTRVDKSIGNCEKVTYEKDENGNEIENRESIPISDNEYINIAIKNLDDLMFDKSGAEAEYGDDLKDVLPVKGETFVSSLTLGDIESATCVDGETERTITVNLKNPVPPQTIGKAYDVADIDEIMAEFEKANAYLTVEKPEMEYSDCQIIIKADLETDEITSVEYIKNIDVKTEITGQGNLADIGTVPVTFRYHESVRYSIDRTDPDAPTVIE